MAEKWSLEVNERIKKMFLSSFGINNEWLNPQYKSNDVMLKSNIED